MLNFLDLEQVAPYIFAVGLVLGLVGFLLGGHNSGGTTSKIFSMLFKSVGIFLLLVAVSYFVTTTISDWSEYSESMR